jgi:hypothetical protein
MLYSIISQERITNIPYQNDYKRWRAKLPDNDYEAVIAELTQRIEGTEIQTSSWMPGRDWNGTVFDPIYSKACNSDYNEAAQFFGLLLWETFLNHPECWAFGRYELDGVPIQGLTYFKVDAKACSGK